MKILTKDPIKADHEQALKDMRRLDEAARLAYLEKLKKSRPFQKYVIDGIIRRHLEELTDNYKAIKVFSEKGGNLSNKDELADFLLNSYKARVQLEKILGDILN